MPKNHRHQEVSTVKNPKARQIFLNLAVLFSTIILALVFFEVIFRIFNISREWHNYYNIITIPSDNKILLYQLRPNYEGNYYGMHTKISSEGLRDYFHGLEKKGSYRIAVVGDSITFGLRVNETWTYPKILERLLNHDLLNKNQTSRKYEVFNFGIPGYGIREEAELIKTRVFDYNPNMIIIGYFLNDPLMSPNQNLVRKTEGDCYAYGTTIRISCTFNTLIFKSQFITYMLGKLGDIYFSFNDYYNGLYEDEKKWSNVVEGFSSISDIAKQHDTEVVLVIFPVVQDLKNYGWDHIHEKVRREAEMRGFYVIDLLDEYSKYNESLITFDSLHPTPLGHEIAAKQIYAYLTEKNLTR